MRRYWHDVRRNGLWTKYFALWGPVQCLTFSVVPEHYRVSFIACVSFFWLIILSTISSKNEADAVVVEPPAALIERSSVVTIQVLEKLVADKKEEPSLEVAAAVE